MGTPHDIVKGVAGGCTGIQNQLLKFPVTAEYPSKTRRESQFTSRTVSDVHNPRPALRKGIAMGKH